MSQSRQGRAWAAGAFATMCSVMAAFLAGALGVQLRDELGLTATEIGLAMGVSFAFAAVCSAPMGRLAERLGPCRGLRVGLSGSMLSMLAIATFGRSFWSLSVLLGAAGVANALNQPSANLLLATHIDPDRLGFALATKQSGMPGAALLGGAAVPAVALTLGWRWAYVIAAGLAVVSMLVVPGDGAVETAADDHSGDGASRPDLGAPLLALYAVVGLLGAASAGAMVGFVTGGAEASGLDPGVAGLVLSVGSAVGIVSRLVQGWQVDHRGVLPIQRLVWLFALGGLGMVALGIDRPAAYLIATVPAFAFGWAWPGLFNLSVVRNNPSAPAAATGISQIGVYIGAAAGPALGGIVVDGAGYRALWIAAGVLLIVGAAIAVYLRSQVKANRLRMEAVV